MKPQNLVVIAAVVLVSIVSTVCLATDAGAARETTLPSGLRLLLLPRPGAGAVLTAVAVDAGAEDEPADRGGLSHFLEHLLFDGVDQLDERGVTEFFERRAAYINAFTRDQTTVFFVLAPPQEAPAAADMLAAMLTRSAVSPESVDKERKVILEELARDESNPMTRKENALRSATWLGTAMERPVGGRSESVGATTHEDIVRFWRTRYTPRNFRVLVAGDRSVEDLDRIAAPFRKLAAAKASLPARPAILDAPGWGQWRTAEGGGGEDAELVLAIAPPRGAALDGAALDLLARWLGDDQGPLHAALVPALARSVAAGRLPRQPQDLLEIRVRAVPGKPAGDVVLALLGALDQAAQRSPDAFTVARLARAEQVERAISGQRLHYVAALFGEAFAATNGKLIDAIDPPSPTADAVSAAARTLLLDLKGRVRAAWWGPGGPAAPTALPEVVTGGLAAAATVGAPGPEGATVSVLANGLTIGAIHEPGSRVFGVNVLVADRALREPADTVGVVDLAQRLLTQGSTISAGERLGRRLERAGIEVKSADDPMIPYDDEENIPDFSYLRLEGPAASLGEGLAVLAEMIKAARFDQSAYERALVAHKQERKAMHQGSAAAALALRKAVFGAGHPLARPVVGKPDDPAPTAAQVKELLSSAWPEGYFAPSRLIVAIAAPAQPEEVFALVDDLFGDGAAQQPQRGPWPLPRPEPSEAPAAAAGGPPQVTLVWGRIVKPTLEDRAALLMAVNALSDRMVAVIREKEGLAYRLGAGVRGLPDGSWFVSASVGTRPDNRERVEQLFAEMTRGLSATELPAGEIERLAARVRQREMLARLSAGARASRLSRLLFEGESAPLAVDGAIQARVAPLQLKDVAQRFLAADGFVHTVAW